MQVLFFSSLFPDTNSLFCLWLKVKWKSQYLRRSKYFGWWFWVNHLQYFAKKIPKYFSIPKLVRCAGAALKTLTTFFLQCSFARGIWNNVLNELGLHWVAPNSASNVLLITWAVTLTRKEKIVENYCPGCILVLMVRMK